MADGAEYDSTKTKLIKVVKIDTVDFRVPSSVIEIVGGSFLNSAFNPCATHIKNVTFEENSELRTVGNYLFSETSLNSIDMSNCLHLTQLSAGIFFKCYNLVNVKLPANLEELPIGAFSECVSLPSLELPDNVKTISSWDSKLSGVFANTKKLRDFIISENSKLATLGSHAFIGSGIQKITLPASLTTILSSPFLDSNLETIEIRPGNPNYKSDGHVVTKNNVIVTIAPYFSGSYEISENLEFGEQAFRGSHISSYEFKANKKYILTILCFSSTKAKEINLPNLIENIPESCFAEASIERITLPTSLKSIGPTAFTKCASLTEVIFPDNLQTISDLAFSSNNNLKHVTIPSNIIDYGQGIFSNCSADITITFENKEKFKEEGKLIIFNNQKVVEYIGKDANYEVQFPSYCKFVGKHLFFGKSLKKVVFTNPSQEMSFNECAFQESTIQEITFPPGLKSIGPHCFNDCRLLSKVVIDGTITEVSKYCFNMCSKLSTIEMQSTSITVIAQYAFNGTSSLTAIDFSKVQLQSICECAFQLSGVQKITLPATVEVIESSAFRESSVSEFYGESRVEKLPPFFLFEDVQLVHIKISSSVKEILGHCFEGCIKLTNVTLSPATETIDMYAFSRCDSLNYITIPENSQLKKIRAFAFDGSFNFNRFEILDTEQFSFDYRCLMNKNKTRIIFYIPVSRAKSFVVPGTVEIIDMYAFYHCKYLREIIIPEGYIQIIGVNAFEGCSMLKRLVLPKSLKTIGKDAFVGCVSLGCGSVTIEESLIPQAIDAKINEIALQKNCINNEDYIQYGIYTCKNRNFRGKDAALLVLLNLFLVL